MIAQTNKPDKRVHLSCWNQTEFSDKKKILNIYRRLGAKGSYLPL